MPEELYIFQKETSAQVFFCEYSEISKNRFLNRTPLVAASGKTNVNSRTFCANRGFVITAGANVVSFVSRLKQKEKFCVAGTIRIFQKKIIMISVCVCVCIQQISRKAL